MHVKHDGRDEDRKADEQHGEEEILSQQGHRQWGTGDDLRYEQEEHGLRQQDGDTERHFLSRVCWQVEDQNWQVRNAHRGNYQVYRVEQGASPKGDVEKYI